MLFVSKSGKSPCTSHPGGGELKQGPSVAKCFGRLPTSWPVIVSDAITGHLVGNSPKHLPTKPMNFRPVCLLVGINESPQSGMHDPSRVLQVICKVACLGFQHV
jgi:hypothetical protein